MVAGERSGDLLGGALLTELQRRGGTVEASGVGGEMMCAAGLYSLARIERLAVMGIVEPLLRLPELLRLRRRLYNHFMQRPPELFVGVDAPDFNLGLEQKLRRRGIPIIHYVSPSVWAWRQGRIARIRRSTDLVLTLFPFEQQFLEQHGIAALCVGHPLADLIAMEPDRAAARAALGVGASVPLIAVLPGSRVQEIARLAPVFLEACEHCLSTYPELRFVVAAVDEHAAASLRALIARQRAPGVFEVVVGAAQQAMTAADLVLCAAGTATLEAMLLKRPMVVAYRMATLSHALVSRMLRISSVALPNILAAEALVPELLQQQAEPQRIARELLALLRDEPRCARLRERFTGLHRQLRRNASAAAADAVLAVRAGAYR